jgi:hypothetical protein
MSHHESASVSVYIPHVSIFWSATRTLYVSVPSQRQYSMSASLTSSRDLYETPLARVADDSSLRQAIRLKLKGISGLVKIVNQA